MIGRHVLLFGALSLGCSAGAAAPEKSASGLVPSYVAIATALAADDLAPVAAAGAEVGRFASALEGKPGIAKVVASLPGLARDDIAAARTAFKPLSDGMIEYMRAEPSTQAGHVIVLCPMAFDDKGALWVQAEGKIANPYFGASMLRCGNKLAWDAALPETASP